MAALIAFISQRSDQAKTSLVKSLSKLLVVSYHVGADRAAREIGTRGSIGIEGLDPVIKRLGTHLDETFGNLGGELTDTIKGGIHEGWSYDHVTREVAGKIKAGWGENITFNNVGRIRDSIQVNPDGTMKRIKTTIERPITMTADTYAETLTRTSMKSAYAQGHYARYEDAGYPGWVYISVADERTRPRHLALHGRVFLFGTDEEAMAREVMKEYRCRCRPKAWFGDPKLDTPETKYATQRADWSRQTFDEWKLDKNMPLLQLEAPQSRKDLRGLTPQLKDRMSGNDWKILAHQMGMSHDDLVDDTLSTIEKNFTYIRQKEGGSQNTAVHIYSRHVLGDISKKTGEPPFTISEVIKAKDEGIIYKHTDVGGEKIKILWKSSDGRPMNVIMSNRYPGKILTAFRIRQSDWDKIVKEGEKLAR